MSLDTVFVFGQCFFVEVAAAAAAEAAHKFSWFLSVGVSLHQRRSSKHSPHGWCNKRSYGGWSLSLRS